MSDPVFHVDLKRRAVVVTAPPRVSGQSLGVVPRRAGPESPPGHGQWARVCTGLDSAQSSLLLTREHARRPCPFAVKRPHGAIRGFYVKPSGFLFLLYFFEALIRQSCSLE